MDKNKKANYLEQVSKLSAALKGSLKEAEVASVEPDNTPNGQLIAAIKTLNEEEGSIVSYTVHEDGIEATFEQDFLDVSSEYYGTYTNEDTVAAIVKTQVGWDLNVVEIANEEGFATFSIELADDYFLM